MDMELRRRTLGGSDFAAIAGLSPWTSALDLWMWMTRKRERPTQSLARTYRMRRGQALESFLRAEYERRSGRIVVVPPEQQEVAGAPAWLRVSYDGLVQKAIGDGHDRVLELKSTSFQAWTRDDVIAQWGPAGTDVIPIHYVPQVMVYGWAAQVDEVDLAADVSGDFRVYTLAVNRPYAEELLAAGEEFMRCVQEDRMPELRRET